MDHSLDHVDVLIVGAGLSGIGAAYHLQAKCPEKSYAILEARSRSGGTWDLFRYPGIRSDSDMYTLGYSFRPWENPKAIADGESILAYVRDTAERNGINQNIRFNHRVVRAEWSSADARWTVTAQRTDDHAMPAPTQTPTPTPTPTPARPFSSQPASSSPARATTAMTAASRPSSTEPSASRAGSSIPSTGAMTSTTPANAWS